MNPVLHKDLLGLLRLKRIAAIQLCFIAVLAGTLLATWPQQGVLSLASKAQDVMLMGLVVGQLVLLCLFVPGTASVALTGEKEGGTFEMLYASRLSPAQIIFGKVMSVISFPILLLISGLPFVALLNWRGDVSGTDLALSYGILLLSALFLAILSLTISSICKQSATALVVAYVTVLVLGGGTLVPAAIMLENQADLPALVLHCVRALSPVAAALSLLMPQYQDMGGASHQFWPIWQIFVPASLAVIVVCFLILVYRLRRPPSEADAYGAGGAADQHRSMARKLMFLIDPKKQRKPFGRTNPVITKEARTSSLRSGRMMIRIFYASVVISLGLALMSLYGGSEHSDLLASVARILVAFQFGLIALVSPSLTSSAVSGEIEGGTFEMLRMSRLSGGKIFWGKFLPGFLPAILPVVALLPGYGAVCFINPEYIAVFVSMLPIIGLAVLVCCTLGLACSSLTDNTARATVVSYMLTAALFVLPIFAWVAMGNQLDERVAKWLAMPSPLVMAINLLPDPSQAPRPIQELWVVHLWTIGGLCVALLLIARVRLSILLKQG